MDFEMATYSSRKNDKIKIPTDGTEVYVKYRVLGNFSEAILQRSQIYYTLVFLFGNMKILLSSVKKSMYYEYVKVHIIMFVTCVKNLLCIFVVNFLLHHNEVSQRTNGTLWKIFSTLQWSSLIFTKDREQGNARGDLGDDANQYLYENISLNENMDFSQIPCDDVFMPMDEPNDSSSLAASNDNASSFGLWKRKNHAKEWNIEAISKNFYQFVEMVGLGFKTMAECAIRNAKAKEHKEATQRSLGKEEITE